MRSFSVFVTVVAIIGMGACSSSDHGPEQSATECICGTLEADIDGCPCAACVSGEGNADNAQCVCGDLRVEPAEGDKE